MVPIKRVRFPKAFVSLPIHLPSKHGSFEVRTGYAIKKARKESTGGAIPDWSSLPEEIWISIIENLPLEDHIHFQSVSTFFLLIARNQRCRSQPRVPWLMHPLGDNSDSWTLFDMISNKVHKIQLPELRRSRILGSSEGWLILVDKLTAELQLFSPFTRDKIQLPPTITFPGIVGAERDVTGQVISYHMQRQRATSRDIFYLSKPRILSKKYFISAFMVPSSCGCIVVVKHGHGGFGLTRVRDNKAAWTAVRIPDREAHNCNFTFFNDLLYVMDNEGRVVSFDICSGNDSPLPPPLEVAPPVPKSFEHHVKFKFYLVSLPDNSELLLLLVSGLSVWVYKLVHHRQQASMKWVNVRTLFGHSLFLTSWGHRHRSMMCLSAKDHPIGVKRNCIYLPAGGSVEVWNMKRRHYNSYCLTCVCHKVGVWIQPLITRL